MQIDSDDAGDPSPTLVREFRAIADALSEITAGVEVLVPMARQSKRKALALDRIVDAVSTIARSGDVCITAVTTSIEEQTSADECDDDGDMLEDFLELDDGWPPDVFPEEWTGA